MNVVVLPARAAAADATPLVAKATDLDQVLEDFERAMLRQRLSPATVRTYRWGLQDLFEQMKEAGLSDARQLNRGILEAWQASMTARTWRPRTKKMAVNAARSFIRWAAESGLVDTRLVESLVKVKVTQAVAAGIPKGDLAQIKAFLLPRRPRMNLVALRDRALFFYLLATGAQVSEALQVRRHDLEAPVVRQTSGTEKVLVMPAACQEFVDDYLRARRDDSPWLWISHQTNSPLRRLGAPGVREIWRKLARKLGIQPWTTHQLRLSPPGPAGVHAKAHTQSGLVASPAASRQERLEAAPQWFEHVASVWLGTVNKRPPDGHNYHRARPALSWLGRCLARAGMKDPAPLKEVLVLWDQEFDKHRSLLSQRTDDALRWMVPAMAEWGVSQADLTQSNWDMAIEDWPAVRPIVSST